MSRLFFVIALLLMSCTTAITGPVVTRAIPADLTSCPGGVSSPEPPGKIKTVESIAAWAVQMQSAFAAEQQARDECARRLRELDVWIETKLAP